VDEKQRFRANLDVFLTELEHKVYECENSESFSQFDINAFDLTLIDYNLFMQLEVAIKHQLTISIQTRNVAFAISADGGTMEMAIEAIRWGAVDFFPKPINTDHLVLLLDKLASNRLVPNVLNKDSLVCSSAYNRRGLEETNKQGANSSAQFNLYHSYRQHAMDTFSMGVFSEKLEEVVNQAYKYAIIRSFPIIIEGETGTGKEYIAKIIHFGERDITEAGPFIDLNCASINTSLFESELFGYEAGSYTGGSPKGSKGKLDLAQGGTLFLDELGELSLESQKKLLRVLQEKEFYRVGGLKKIVTDARIVAATNVNLEQAMNEGSFRKDLYYRLKIGTIIIPPLRERKEEIIPLALKFLQDFAQKEGHQGFQVIDKEASELLLNCSWYGNVRELSNLMELINFTYRGHKLRREHLQMVPQSIEQCAHEQLGTLKSHSDEYVRQTLEDSNGNKSLTARQLGISRRSLYRKLESLEIK
jgi:transcriptional regulator with PAS, ATPase and Fis domain